MGKVGTENIRKNLSILIKKAKGSAREHKFFAFLVLFAIVFDFFYDLGKIEIEICFVKEMTEGIYMMRSAILGIVISVSSLLFATFTFSFNNRSQRYLGVEFREIYEYQYQRKSSESGNIFRIALPAIVIFWICNFMCTVFVFFCYMIRKCVKEFRRILLLLNEKEMQEIIRREIGKIVYEESEEKALELLKKVLHAGISEAKDRVFIADLCSELLKKDEIRTKEPAWYYRIFREIAKAIWDPNAVAENEKQSVRNRFLLTLFEQMGNKLQEAENSGNYRENVARYLAADIGILTILIQFSDGRDIYILENVFEEKKLQNYWNGWEHIIAWVVIILFEILYKMGYYIEPLFTYLMNRKINKRMLYGIKMNYENKKLIYMLSMNFVYNTGFPYEVVVQVCNQFLAGKTIDIPGDRTYMKLRGF